MQLLAVILLTLLADEQPPQPVVPKGSIQVVFLPTVRPTPDGTMTIAVDPKGRMFDLRGNEIAAAMLEKALQVNRAGEELIVRVIVPREDQTTLATFGDSVQKIIKAADPKAKTVILLSIKAVQFTPPFQTQGSFTQEIQ